MARRAVVLGASSISRPAVPRRPVFQPPQRQPSNRRLSALTHPLPPSTSFIRLHPWHPPRPLLDMHVLRSTSVTAFRSGSFEGLSLSLSRARTDQPAPVFILKPSVRYFRPDRFSLPCVYSRISSGWYLPAFPFLFSFPCSFCASFMEDGSRRLELTGSFNSEIEKTKTSVRWRKMKNCASFRFCMGFDDFFLF